MGPALFFLVDPVSEKGGFPGGSGQHRIAMLISDIQQRRIWLRMPAEPSPPPIHEPPDPPEGPDVIPVREPDPEEPEEI